MLSQLAAVSLVKPESLPLLVWSASPEHRCRLSVSQVKLTARLLMKVYLNFNTLVRVSLILGWVDNPTIFVQGRECFYLVSAKSASHWALSMIEDDMIRIKSLKTAKKTIVNFCTRVITIFWKCFDTLSCMLWLGPSNSGIIPQKFSNSICRC